MTNGRAALASTLRRRTDLLLEARGPEAVRSALLDGALALGCAQAWLWEKGGNGWSPVASRGCAPEAAPDLVLAVLTGRLPASLLCGSAVLVRVEPRALVTRPSPTGVDIEALEDALESLLHVARALVGDDLGPPGPFPAPES